MRALGRFLIKKSLVISLVLLVAFSLYVSGKNKGVLLTEVAVAEIKSNLGEIPLFDRSVKLLVDNVEHEIGLGIDVPMPKDPAGGYTHNRHKDNYIAMSEAATLWRVLGDVRYAEYVKTMLLKYADLYPTLGEHPIKASYAPGKLFWQQLNEAVWMVYVSEAYSSIKGYLTKEEIKKIENDLLIPYVNFLSVESTNVFNRIHNHGVWAAAAVGMAGYAMERDDIVKMALYGVEVEGEDNDKPKGFFSQLDLLFSPDGYYTEGPYYQRYAMLPYILFAQAIDNNNPEVKIFEYRDQILKKAVVTTLQLTNTDGKFFPFNDALKSMSFKAPELINAVDIIYGAFPEMKELLSVAIMQNRVVINNAGIKVAKAIADGEAKPFQWASKEYRDGAEGKDGAIGVLRSSPNKGDQTVTMQYGSQGMGHGHFDRLSIIYYDNNREILQDYGAARYVNIAYKHGGRYLPENKTWAKQTIAHNTLVVDGQSQFGGKLDKASATNGEPYIFDFNPGSTSVMSGKESYGYGDVKAHRSIFQIVDTTLFEHSIMVDILRYESNTKHTYEVPFYYQGQFLSTNVNYSSNTETLSRYGTENGYQHLWHEGVGTAKAGTSRVVWMSAERLYTLTTLSESNDKINFVRIGATDPEISLRKEPAVILKREDNGSGSFINIVEVHGEKNFDTELVKNHKSSIANIIKMVDNDQYTVVDIELLSGKTIRLAISNQDSGKDKKHSVLLQNGQRAEWSGVYSVVK